MSETGKLPIVYAQLYARLGDIVLMEDTSNVSECIITHMYPQREHKDKDTHEKLTKLGMQALDR